jgi:hypothetical protein
MALKRWMRKREADSLADRSVTKLHPFSEREAVLPKSRWGGPPPLRGRRCRP